MPPGLRRGEFRFLDDLLGGGFFSIHFAVGILIGAKGRPRRLRFSSVSWVPHFPIRFFLQSHQDVAIYTGWAEAAAIHESLYFGAEGTAVIG